MQMSVCQRHTDFRHIQKPQVSPSSPARSLTCWTDVAPSCRMSSAPEPPRPCAGPAWWSTWFGSKRRSRWSQQWQDHRYPQGWLKAAGVMETILTKCFHHIMVLMFQLTTKLIKEKNTQKYIGLQSLNYQTHLLTHHQGHHHDADSISTLAAVLRRQLHQR